MSIMPRSKLYPIFSFNNLCHTYLLLNFSEQNPIDHHLTEYKNHLRIAKVYYAYSVIYSYMKEPFTTHSPVSLFNVSRFILNEVEQKGVPKGVSML